MASAIVPYDSAGLKERRTDCKYPSAAVKRKIQVVQRGGGIAGAT